MPSPFPGMDPYWEDPASWGGVHQGMITYAQAALNALLPDRYAAMVGERVYIVQPDGDRDVYPDVAVLEHPRRGRSAEERATGAVAMAGVQTGDPPWVLSYEPVEIREVFVEIIAPRHGGHIVCVIEVLSPSNKAKGSEGRKLYLTKQQDILQSETHLVEIDLLRRGEHTVGASRQALRRKGRWDYLVCLHRGGDGNRFEVWPIGLRERLPRIRVPLMDGDPVVVLDLQTVFDRCYDEGGFGRWVDYRREPSIPLNGLMRSGPARCSTAPDDGDRGDAEPFCGSGLRLRPFFPSGPALHPLSPFRHLVLGDRGP